MTDQNTFFLDFFVGFLARNSVLFAEDKVCLAVEDEPALFPEEIDEFITLESDILSAFHIVADVTTGGDSCLLGQKINREVIE